MKMHMIIRRFAGAFVLASLVLAHFHSPYWLWFTAFVGLNLLQSSFTNFCPLEMALKKWVRARIAAATRKGPAVRAVRDTIAPRHETPPACNFRRGDSIFLRLS